MKNKHLCIIYNEMFSLHRNEAYPHWLYFLIATLICKKTEILIAFEILIADGTT